MYACIYVYIYHLIQKNFTEGLNINSTQTPRSHIQPKIDQNPGRPVISSLNCHTSKISEYVDYHLQPIDKQIPSCAKYPSDFISKPKTVETVPDNSYLASLDVKSLYTNISYSEGMKAMKTSLDNFSRKTIATKVITTFLTSILMLKFVLNCKNYIQMKGCAMGTICSPSYTNIFTDHFERKYISPFLQELSLIYLRFVDNKFFVWTNSKEQLVQNLDELNTKHNSIKLEYKISKTSISFLDTEMYIKNNKLYTKIYRKYTNPQSFLHINSEHPKLLKDNTPYSQAL